MYSAALPTFPATPLWLADLPHRLRDLAQGAPRVAYFYEAPDTSTFRYRAWNMIEALRSGGEGIGAAWFCRDDLVAADAILARCDTLVVCRARYSAELAQFVGAARSLGRRVLFDVDDLVFDPAYAHLVMETLDQPTCERDFDHWFAYISRMGQAMRLCDGVIVTNSKLAEQAATFSGLPVSVVPNFMNAGQLAASRKVLDAKQRSGFRRDGRVHIGYFSGTPSHNADFRLVADSLAEAMARNPRIVLRIVGFLDLPPCLASLSHRVERIPLQDYLNLQRAIGEVELNLVPLQDNVFTRCKSELKLFEAAVVGVPSLASPVFALAEAMRTGPLGELAPAHLWPEALDRAIAVLEENPAPAAQAMARWAEERYRPERHAAAVREALFAPPPAAPAVAPPAARTLVAMPRQERLLADLPIDARIIEIGPSVNPVAPKASGWRTTVVDHADQATLRAKYGGLPGVDAERIEGVDVVWQGGALDAAFPEEALGGYTALIASHVLEHLPDPIGLLLAAQRLLHPERGVVLLGVPDKRLCFDLFRPASSTGQMLAAWHEKREHHPPACVFDHAAYTAEVDDSAADGSGLRFAADLEHAYALFEAAWNPERAYEDFHGWRFTPASFELLVLELGALGILDWQVEWLHPETAVEFLARLRRGRRSFACPDELQHARANLLRRMLQEQAIAPQPAA